MLFITTALLICSASPTMAPIPAMPVTIAQANVPTKGGEVTAPAADGSGSAEGGEKQGDPPGFGSTLLVMGLIFLFFWLFFIRPQNKQMKEHKALIEGLKKGDPVVTQGGMFGRVVGFDDSTNAVLVEIAKDVRVRVVRNQISSLQSSLKAGKEKADDGAKTAAAKK